jgi:5-methylcytosine-specific restriction endonuclease McrA
MERTPVVRAVPAMMLNAEVLVLNRVYLPIRVTTYQGKARAILPDYSTFDFEGWVRRPGGASDDMVGMGAVRLPVPRVIVLRQYAGVPRHEVRFSRKNVFARDGHRCQYCGQSRPSRELNVDHVVPLSRGGPSTWENVVCCCVPCNRRKGNRLPDAAGMRLLRQPRRPRWHPLHDASRRRPHPVDWAYFVDAAILEWEPGQDDPAQVNG